MSVDEPPAALDRQGIIDITVDVHNFLAAVSQLKKAMEEADGCDGECERGRGEGGGGGGGVG